MRGTPYSAKESVTILVRQYRQYRAAGVADAAAVIKVATDFNVEAHKVRTLIDSHTCPDTVPLTLAA